MNSVAPIALFVVVVALSLLTYAVTAFVLIKVLRDRYRSVPASRVTAAGAAIFVAGIGLLFLSGERFWKLPLNVALMSGAVGAAIVNVGATMIVGPWLAGLVASDLRRVPISRGTRGTEAHLATTLVRLASQYGGEVEYDRAGTYDFDVRLGRRDLRVELGALSPNPDPNDVITDPAGWFERIDALVTADPPTELQPVLVMVNSEMLDWLRAHDLGFGRFDDDVHFAFTVWDGTADDDERLAVTVEALLFGITSAARRAAVTPHVAGLGVNQVRRVND